MSEAALVVTLIVAILAVVVLLVALTDRVDRRRAAEFKKSARRLGWTDGDEAAAPPAGVQAFQLFNQGRSRKAAGVYTGRPGRFDATLFDYRYTTGGGSASSIHRQTVLAFELPESALPQFEVRPENIFHKIGTAFGMQDIDLDNRPEFSKAYLLRGADEAEVRRLFEMGLARHLEQTRGWSVEGAGNWVAVYRAGKRIKPDDLRDFVHDCDRIASAIARR